MYYLLFFFYLLLACYFVSRSAFVRRTGISTKIIIPLFLLKVAAGLALGYIVQKYSPDINDYWRNNNVGSEEYHLLVTDPIRFVTSITESNYAGYGTFFGSANSYWNDLQLNLVLKIVAVLDIFTRGNYYVNSIFFSLMAFLGSVALYRVFIDIYKEKKWPIVIGCFLLPSTIYFTAGVHKDSIIFLMLGIFSYSLYFSLVKKLTYKRIIGIAMSFVFILLLKGYLAIILLPASIALILCIKLKLRPVLTFAGVYGLGVLLLFLGEFILPAYQPLKAITAKQEAFFELPDANSSLQKDTIAPTIIDLAKHAPKALQHAIWHPYLLEYPSVLYNFPAVEMSIYFLLFLWMLYQYKKQNLHASTFVCFAVFLTLTAFLLIGYIVPYPGAIVRYRSLFFPFIITPLLAVFAAKTFRINKFNI